MNYASRDFAKTPFLLNLQKRYVRWAKNSKYFESSKQFRPLTTVEPQYVLNLYLIYHEYFIS